MKNILITGSNGYIASAIKYRLSNKYNLTCITRDNFDLTNTQSLNQWFKDKEFDCVIHTASVGGNRLVNDDKNILSDNLLMYENLYSNRNKFNQMIYFGSGADSFDTPYGVSKKIIKESINNTNKFFNIRIFAVFDSQENDRRFIKSSLTRYIKKQPIVIHQNKLMDFFYMEDLISIVDNYIMNNNGLKNIDCSYDYHLSLYTIANFINTLDNYTVPIEFLGSNEPAQNYIGEYCGIRGLIGLHDGIRITFNRLKSIIGV